MITIVDYGVGNLASIQNMLKKCSILSRVSNNHVEISEADKLILPGVGAFDTAMQKLNETDLGNLIKQQADRGTLILGICLGAQLLTEGSEEGTLQGLSLIKGKCKKFDAAKIAPLRVPHMGWREVNFINSFHPLSNYNGEEPRFYFSHSYYLSCDDANVRFATCHYGHEFTCGVLQDNIMGVQFHPEKSHRFGAQFLTNFAQM